MRRREFIQLLTLLALGGLSLSANSNKRNEKTCKVIIIGAGIAGLAAGNLLKAKGYDVQIIEARHRIGGRIWTHQGWSGMPLDLGATWIHGAQRNPLSQLADEIFAQRIETSYENSLRYNAKGKLVSDKDNLSLEQLEREVFRWIKKAQNSNKDQSLSDVIRPLLNKISDQPEAQAQLNFILNSTIEQEYAGRVEDLSTHWFDSAKEFGDIDVLFKEGFEVITNHLARGLDILLGQEVKDIHLMKQKVAVKTLSDSFYADKVIVTVPLGVLKSQKIDFLTPLTTQKNLAINKLGMGILNKCYLKFPKVFWPQNIDWLEYIPEHKGVWSQWVSFKNAANLPVLLGFNAATHGRTIEKMSDEEVIEEAMGTLRVIFGSKIPTPVEHIITRWGSDPFSLGSYSYNALGSHPSMRSDLASPINHTLFFAGEATSRNYFGTAHGAFLSGIEAADAIMSSPNYQ